jgi:hypothetical protein
VLLVGIEADSLEWHTSREAFERDRIRSNEFAALGLDHYSDNAS